MVWVGLIGVWLCFGAPIMHTKSSLGFARHGLVGHVHISSQSSGVESKGWL